MQVKLFSSRPTVGGGITEFALGDGSKVLSICSSPLISLIPGLTAANEGIAFVEFADFFFTFSKIIKLNKILMKFENCKRRIRNILYHTDWGTYFSDYRQCLVGTGNKLAPACTLANQ